MSIKETDLPVELNAFQAVEAAYPCELSRCYDAITRGLPVMVECHKELTPYFYKCLRDRLNAHQPAIRSSYLDGRQAPEQQQGMPMGMIQTMIAQLTNIVRGSVTDQQVVVLPHLDLLTTSQGGITSEAKEAIPLLYENPNILWLGFKDPSMSVPCVIKDLFPHHIEILGIPRDRLPHLVTQRESRKFGRELNLYQLYKFVSGINAVRLRRILPAIDGEDYPENPQHAFDQVRAATLAGQLQVPEVDLDKDVGGYGKVKDRLKKEVLNILAMKDKVTSAEEIKRIEKLIPRGMIFWGPPGTGKTLFAKALATALGAAVQIISGPELKSKWVGESEERIRQIFVKGRESAPCIIVFDELDSFATARGTYTGSGVEHSMVNQLLTEMDGFRANELVFVVGTTNFVESLDPALLRPGRFEFHLHIPFPSAKDRQVIFEIYNKKLGLEFSERAFDFAVKRTRDLVEGSNSRYTGDHIEAMCRAIARRRLREDIKGPTEMEDVERSLTEYVERPELTPAEQRTVAVHEAGHAVVSLHCEYSPPIERISIKSDFGQSLGHVRHSDPANKYVLTRNVLLDSICTLFGGREAEELMQDDVSVGAAMDLQHATQIAKGLVEELGLGGKHITPRLYKEGKHNLSLSEDMKKQLDLSVNLILDEQCRRAKEILEKHRDELIALRDLLLERKVLDREALGTIFTQDQLKQEDTSD